MKKSIFRQSKYSFYIRFIFVSLYAAAELFLFKLLVAPFQIPINFWLLTILYIIGMNIASEGNFLIDKYFNKVMPWVIHGKKRVSIQLAVTFLWTAVVVVVPFSLRLIFFEKNNPGQHFTTFALYTFILGALFLIMYNAIYISINFFRKWKESILEIERIKQAKLKSDYKILQDQLNPHFLFNSFNVLISEITYDPPKAIEFTRRLSQVYRYVLQSKNSDVVTLEAELEFVKSYIYLHKVRVEDALIINIEINESSLEKLLPPLTIQILIENALKHNIANIEKPLTITIKSADESTLKVVNNLQVKDSFDSTQTGLTNVKDRYSILGDKKVIIELTEKEFSVIVPLYDK